MEILVELALGLLQVVGEILLQVIFEGLFEFGVRSATEPFRRTKTLHPFLAGIGYVMLGGTAGAISLWIFPHRLIATPWLRVVNLLVTPVVAGAAMAAIGAWRRKRDEELIRLDRFAYGFLFALVMAIVRIMWGR